MAAPVERAPLDALDANGCSAVMCAAAGGELEVVSVIIHYQYVQMGACKCTSTYIYIYIYIQSKICSCARDLAFGLTPRVLHPGTGSLF